MIIDLAICFFGLEKVSQEVFRNAGSLYNFGQSEHHFGIYSIVLMIERQETKMDVKKLFCFSLGFLVLSFVLLLFVIVWVRNYV